MTDTRYNQTSSALNLCIVVASYMYTNPFYYTHDINDELAFTVRETLLHRPHPHRAARPDSSLYSLRSDESCLSLAGRGK